MKTSTVCALAIAALPSATLAYPIDCAILLCLAGGFPPSAECTAAKAVFIRRITPFPIEPPLQVWNCPMGASAPLLVSPQARIYDAVFAPLSLPPAPGAPLTDDFWGSRSAGFDVSGSFVIPAQSYPSGDISDPAYDFVRSIKVWHLDYSQQQTRDSCERRDQSRIGGYDLVGAYTWLPHRLRHESISISGPSETSRDGERSVSYSWAAPLEASIHEADPSACDPFDYRAVVVTWQDYFGGRGFHEVRY